VGLFDWFRNKGDAEDDAPKPTAIDYVEWLLVYMLKMSKQTLKIETWRPLPGSDALPPDVEPPPCLPEPMMVINRLRILSGVNPMRGAGIQEGRFERPRKHVSIDVSTKFQEDDQGAVCWIQLAVRNREP